MFSMYVKSGRFANVLHTVGYEGAGLDYLIDDYVFNQFCQLVQR